MKGINSLENDELELACRDRCINVNRNTNILRKDLSDYIIRSCKKDTTTTINNIKGKPQPLLSLPSSLLPSSSSLSSSLSHYHYYYYYYHQQISLPSSLLPSSSLPSLSLPSSSLPSSSLPSLSLPSLSSSLYYYYYYR